MGRYPGWESVTADQLPSKAGFRRSQSKYKAVKTTVDGITFDSKKEAARYSELKLMEQAGDIRHLILQPRYELSVTFHMLGGESMEVPIGYYVADFRYTDRDANTVVEDVKGMKTPMYRWKKRHVEAQYGIEIREV